MPYNFHLTFVITMFELYAIGVVVCIVAPFKVLGPIIIFYLVFMIHNQSRLITCNKSHCYKLMDAYALMYA